VGGECDETACLDHTGGLRRPCRPGRRRRCATHSRHLQYTSEQEIAALFDRWNRSLQTGDAHQVVANYAARSILLPTTGHHSSMMPEAR